MTTEDLEKLDADVNALITGGAVFAQDVGQRINNFSRQLYRDFQELVQKQAGLKKSATAYCAYINAAHADEIKQQQEKKKNDQ